MPLMEVEGSTPSRNDNSRPGRHFLDTKDARRFLANADSGYVKPENRRVAEQAIARGDGDSYHNTNHKEDSVIEALDQKDFLIKHASWVEKLREGKVDVGQFLMGLSPEIAIQLVSMAFLSGSDKVKLAAIQDVLDRAGFGKVNKHAIAAVDASQSREALVSMLLGATKDLAQQGIEIVDDTKPKDPA